jgi:hypothetical protein
VTYFEEESMIPPTLLPEDLQQQAFIAGGYAACPALALDMDIWVRVNGDETMHDAKQRIIDWLENTMWPYEAATTRLSSPGVILGGRDGYDHLDINVLKVATVKSVYLTHPYHIMVVNVDPATLIEAFDISTHQIALAWGNVIKGSGWTPITEPPRMLRRTPTTPERMEKIAARYGHALTPQEIR